MNMCFKEMKEDCSVRNGEFLELKKIFEKFIEPIYGCQEKFLEKIRIGLDRKCIFLVNRRNIEGILIYKTKNSFEYEELNIKNALEIKTLMLVHQNKKFAGLMIASLYRQAALAAIENKADCILATVSSNLKPAYNIAKKLGFSKIGALKEKNINRVEELIVCHPNPAHLLEKTSTLQNKAKKSLFFNV